MYKSKGLGENTLILFNLLDNGSDKDNPEVVGLAAKTEVLSRTQGSAKRQKRNLLRGGHAGPSTACDRLNVILFLSNMGLKIPFPCRQRRQTGTPSAQHNEHGTVGSRESASPSFTHHSV